MPWLFIVGERCCLPPNKPPFFHPSLDSPWVPSQEFHLSLAIVPSLSSSLSLPLPHSHPLTNSLPLSHYLFLSLSKDPWPCFSLFFSLPLPPCSCMIKSWSKLLQQFNSSRIHCQSVWQMNERWLIWAIVNWLDVWYVQSLARVENSRTNWGLDKVSKQKGLQLQSFAEFNYELF
jgi:hypothetical protein